LFRDIETSSDELGLLGTQIAVLQRRDRAFRLSQFEEELLLRRVRSDFDQ
jgi:hypothetical protein